MRQGTYWIPLDNKRISSACICTFRMTTAIERVMFQFGGGIIQQKQHCFIIAFHLILNDVVYLSSIVVRERCFRLQLVTRKQLLSDLGTEKACCS